MSIWKWKSTMIILVGLITLLLLGASIQAAPPVVQQEISSAPEVTLLRGEEAIAKLLERGFTRDQVEQMIQKARQRLKERQNEGEAPQPEGPGGDFEALNCAPGQGAGAVFETLIGPMGAAFQSTLNPTEGLVSDVCDEAFCTYFHGIGGLPDRAYWGHTVVADWAEHIAAWCN